MMGSETGEPRERPPHSVTFAEPFYLGATEVTFAQYDLFCALTDCDPPSDENWIRDNRPVINVTWNNAREYADWLSATTGRSCRLPSEAEWEYAARARTTTTNYALPAPDGSDDIADKGLANCDGCGSEWDNEKTAPVGSFEPNDWGLYDMHGNVMEWVEDCWHQSYEGTPPPDGRAWLKESDGNCVTRVLRGGSWNDSQVDAQSAYRGRDFSFVRFLSVGFRVLCSSPIFDH